MGAGHWRREDSSEGIKMVAGRGSRGGKKLWRCEVRPHLNPLPGGEEVASLCNPYPTPTPGGGQAPALHFSIDAGRRRQAREPLQPMFVPIADAGWFRHTKV